MTLKKTFLLTAVSIVASTASAQWNTDSTEYDSFKHYRIGGYGEMLANFKDYGINRFNGTSEGNSKVRRNTISIPRMVLAGDAARFRIDFILFSCLRHIMHNVGEESDKDHKRCIGYTNCIVQHSPCHYGIAIRHCRTVYHHANADCHRCVACLGQCKICEGRLVAGSP